MIGTFHFSTVQLKMKLYPEFFKDNEVYLKNGEIYSRQITPRVFDIACPEYGEIEDQYSFLLTILEILYKKLLKNIIFAMKLYMFLNNWFKA